MSQDITPFDFSKYGIRWEVFDGEQWAVLNDFCEYLGLTKSQASNYASKLPKEVLRLEEALDSRGARQKTNYINRKGIRLILRVSKSEIAQQFQEWLGGEVFESIVEEGAYLAPWISKAERARISERLEYENIKDMLAAATDYDKSDPYVRQFFIGMQNMFHVHVTGLTAQQLKSSREIVTWKDMQELPKPNDYKTGKNFLNPDELEESGLTLVYVMSALALKLRKKPYTMRQFVNLLKKELARLKLELED